MNGHLHPITQFNRLSFKYFQDLGFDIMEGNEIESEWWNFDAVNVPADHPARDVQDTFWLANANQSAVASRMEHGRIASCGIPSAKADGKPNLEKEALRVHNTGSEARLIAENKIKPPFRIVVPGRDYRNERTDKTHEHTFYQIDGIICDSKVNMTNLIGILDGWIKFTLGNDVKTRIRPSYFPFVEPGMEMDIKISQNSKFKSQNGGLVLRSSESSARCSDEGWREMLGAGMAHPIVLKNMGIDPEKYQAAMWGPGIDRFTMIKYNIDDIRRFHSQDLRFLKQF